MTADWITEKRFYYTKNLLDCVPDTNRRFIYLVANDERLIEIGGDAWTADHEAVLLWLMSSPDEKSLRRRVQIIKMATGKNL